MEIKKEYWDPEVGESIDGILLTKRTRVGKYESNLYEIQTKDVIYMVWGRIQLDSLMKLAKENDHVVITYTGVVKSGDYAMRQYELEIVND